MMFFGGIYCVSLVYFFCSSTPSLFVRVHLTHLTSKASHFDLVHKSFVSMHHWPWLHHQNVSESFTLSLSLSPSLTLASYISGNSFNKHFPPININVFTVMEYGRKWFNSIKSPRSKMINMIRLTLKNQLKEIINVVIKRSTFWSLSNGSECK